MRLSGLLAVAFAGWSTAASAEVATLISAPLDGPVRDGGVEVELLFANRSAAPEAIAAPAQVDANVRVADRSLPARLERIADDPAPVAVAAGGFRRVRYRLALPPDLPAGALALISAPGLRSNSAAFLVPTNLAAAPVAPPARLEPAPAATAEGGGNAFLAGLSGYQPIYALVGYGTDSDAKLQLSFKYQLFGAQGLFGGDGSWLDGLHFAYTQRMFWDIGRNSAPFRNIDFQPELIYLLQSRSGTGLQLGIRHESNGREGSVSRSVNTVYVQPSLTLPLGGYELLVSPRAWLYFGKQRGNKDIERYRGYTGLALELGKDDGLRIATSGRMNFASGKGSAQADVSYPLDRLVWDRLNLYLYGQVFTGYGENLLDYNRRLTRARIGIAIVR